MGQPLLFVDCYDYQTNDGLLHSYALGIRREYFEKVRYEGRLIFFEITLIIFNSSLVCSSSHRLSSITLKLKVDGNDNSQGNCNNVIFDLANFI